MGRRCCGSTDGALQPSRLDVISSAGLTTGAPPAWNWCDVPVAAGQCCITVSSHTRTHHANKLTARFLELGVDSCRLVMANGIVESSPTEAVPSIGICICHQQVVDNVSVSFTRSKMQCRPAVVISAVDFNAIVQEALHTC